MIEASALHPSLSAYPKLSMKTVDNHATTPPGSASRKPVERDVLEQLAARVAAGLGYDVVDLEWKHEAGSWVLRVFIDFIADENGAPVAPVVDLATMRHVSLDDCTHLSRALSAELDVAELITVPFTLEVSSPGVNRPLRRESDFRRFAGHKAKIRARAGLLVPGAPADSTPRRNFAGKLLGAEGGTLRIEADGQVFEIPVDDVEKAQLQFEFKSAARPAPH